MGGPPPALRRQRALPLLRRSPLFLCLLLAGFHLFALSQIVSTSPTFDEGFAFLRGYAAWRTGRLVPIGHPPLAHWLSGLGVLLEPGLPDPRGLEGWQSDDYDDTSRDFLWEQDLDADRIVFLGRYPILLLGLVLGAVCIRWARDWLGGNGALGAGLLHALSPNLIAHSALATTDLPVAAFYVFTLYGWSRFTRRPTPARAAALGLMLGLALAAKFSSLLLLPTLAALFALWAARSAGRLPHLARLSSIIPAVAGLTLWASYAFAIDPYPLAQYVRELADLQSLASEGHTAYLLGRLSARGWWYYHPFVFLVKTPLPVLVLLGLGLWRGMVSLVRAARRTAPGYDAHFLTLLAASSIYFLAAAASSLNVGYRYLLPALPLLHIVAASAVIGMSSAAGRVLVVVLFAWHLLSTLLIVPHFLAYFNELVGPSNGHRVLADSNLDWGQDLPALARYLDGRRVHLSYFGQADPAYYGIVYDPLPAWPPRPEGGPAPAFAPADPAPGLYALSASNLVGAQLHDPNTFAYFRDRRPLAAINYSIFVYEVPVTPAAASLVQCAPPLLTQQAADALLGGRALRRAVVDCAHSLLLPDGGAPALLLFPEGHAPLLDLGPPVFEWKRSDGTTYYRLYKPWPLPRSTMPPVAEGAYLTLVDYQLTPSDLTLHWRVEAPPPPPVSVFVHFNWPDGALAEAYDALGVPAEYWQAGDVIVQRHPISPDLPPGEYGVQVGLYSLADGTRYSEIDLSPYQK